MKYALMSHKRSIIIIVVLIYFFVTMFVYIHVTKLTEDDLEWVDTYNYGDSIFFTSTHGNLDTLVVTEKFINNSQERFYFSEGLGPNKEANAGLNFILKHGKETFDGGLCIKKAVGDSLLAVISVWKRYALEIRISGDRIITDKDNSSYSEHMQNRVQNKVEKFVWSKEHGLIYYKFEDGEEFFREDLLPDTIEMGIISRSDE